MSETPRDDRERLISFDCHIPTRVVFGAGALDRLGEVSRSWGDRALVVTDPGIVSAGHVERAVTSLEAAGIHVTVFTEVEENPTTEHVARCVSVAMDSSINLIVGLGGGSSLDTAKGANFLLTNGGKMADYWGVNKATKPMLPMIAVPTTAGTGSEAQSFALIADAVTHQKMACGDKKAACKVAILDPAVTVSQPPRVSAVVGIDAMAHALESFVSTKRGPVSSMYAAEAWRLLSGGFERVLAAPDDLDARGRMLLGANFAGTAIEQSMLGATHSAANPLTARYGITHGIAIGVMLPHVLRFNAAEVDELYASLAPTNGKQPGGTALAGQVREFVRHAGLPTELQSLGIERDTLGQLADEAANQWTARFNPRAITAADFRRLYEAAYNDE